MSCRTGLLLQILLVTVIQKSTGTSWICPTGSIFCYQRLEPETWENSYDQCIQKGGELPALDHQAYLEDWLRDSQTTYSWLSLKFINSRFQWMNITPLYWEYSKKQFANGHPLPQHGCVRANETVLFETTSCQEKNDAMCVIRSRNRETIEAALELPEDSFQVVLKVRNKNTSIISDYLRVTREDFSTVQLHCVVESSETSLPRRPKFISWLKDGVYLHLKPQMLQVTTVYDRTKQSSASLGATYYSQQGTFACEVVQLGNKTRTRSNTTLITLTESLNQILVVRHRSASLTLDFFMDSIKKFYKQVLQNEAKGHFDVSHAVEKLNWDCLVERQLSVNNSISVAWNVTVYIDVGEDKSNYGAAIAWFAGWNGTAAFQQWLAIQNTTRFGFRGVGLSLTILYAEWCQSTSMQIKETRLTWGTTIPAAVASEPLCLNMKNQPVSRFCYPNYFYGAAWTPFPSQDCKKYKYSNAAFCPMGYQEGNRGCFRLTEQHAWEAAMSECFGYYPNGHSDQFGFTDWLAAASNMSLDDTPQLIWLPARRYTRYGQLYISFLWKKPTLFPENWTQLKFVDNQQHNKMAAMCLALDRRLSYLQMLDCSTQLPAVCLTKKFVKTSVTTTIKPFQCPLNWFSHRVIPRQSTCFKRFQSVEALTWDQARNNCVAAGASLVHINDSMLQIVVGQVYAFGDGESPNNLPAWIGLRRVNDNGKYCWHYGNTEPNSTECSSNGYENWTPLSLDNDFMNGYGVYIDTFGQWRPLPATMTLRSYICQMEIRSTVKHSLHIHRKGQNLYEVKLKENVPNFKAQPINANLNFKDLIEIHNTKSQQTTSKAPKSFTGNTLLPYCFLDGMFQDSYTEPVPILVNKTGLLTCYMWLESPRVLIRSNTEYAKLRGRHVYIARSVMRNDTYNSTLHDATWQQSLYGTQYGNIIGGNVTSRVQREASSIIGKEIKISVKILGFFPFDKTSLGIDYRIECQITHGTSTPVLTTLQQDVRLLQLLRDALLKSSSSKQTAPVKSVRTINNLEYIYVRSIDYCSAITTTLQPGKDASTVSWDRPENLTWDLTPVGVTIYAKELCVDPTGHILLRRCEDDLQTGADWGSIKVGDRLLEEPIGQEICSEPSETTVRLWSLVQNIKEPGSTADSDPLKDLLNITQSWDPQTVDVKLSALALGTALHSHQVVRAMQFNQSIVILDNVIKVGAEQLATTQRLLNASNSFITALEDVQNRAVIEAGESSIRATSEFILVEAYDVSDDLIGYEANRKTKDDTFQYANIETRPLYKSTLQEPAPEASLSDVYVAVLLPDSILNHSSITNASQRISFSVLQDGRFMEASALTNENETMSIYQFNYSHPKQYETSAGYRYNSPIAQINVRGISEEMPLSAPISAAFRPTLRNKKPICVSWQKHLNGNRGGWSPDKCRYVGRRDGLDVCQCSHLSFYAELFNVYDENLALENELHAITLNIITIVGCSLSLIGLVCVVLTFLLFPEWRKSTGNKVLFNLALALLGFLAVFLAGFDLTSERQLCKYVAIALHYFLLVSFAWMLVEAIHQYYRLVKYMGTYIARFMWKTTPFAWGLPILPVMAVLLYDHEDSIYRNNPRCWIGKDAFYPAVLGPITAILAVNIAIFALIIRSVVCCRAKLRTNQPHSRLVLQQFNMSVCVFFLLGLSWVFGFMTVNDSGIFFTYLFCIFNSLQGFFIFVFFVLRERNARQLWGDLWYGRDSRRSGANQMIALSSGNRSQSRVPDTHTRHTRI